VHARLSEKGIALDQNLAGLYICPMHHELVKDVPGTCDICGMELVSTDTLIPNKKQGEAEADPQAPLLIPRTAPLMTGKRAVVYVKEKTEKPTFSMREIILGPRVGDKYVVMSGLNEGEEVVYSGSFKIDASRQLLARSSMMSLPNEDSPSFAGNAGDNGKELTQQIDKLQASYYAAQVELAEDRSGKAAMAQLATALTLVSVEDIDKADQDKWKLQAEPLARKLARYAGAADLEEERETFDEVSRHFISLLTYFGATQPAYQFHCPMGPGDEGSSWLQPEQDLLNPYMGSRMLKCGSATGELRRRQ